MLEFNQEFLNEKIISPFFFKFINSESYDDNKIEISLPLFFNTGDTLDIIIEKKDDYAILKNLSHRLIEESLSDRINFLALRKNYFFGKAPKIKEIQKTYLEKNGINNSLLQEKVISFNNEEEVKKDFFSYCFYVLRYYNFIHDYFLSYSNEKLENHFEKEIYSFIESYNKTKNIQLKEIEKNEIDTVSQNNKYFYDEKIILTGVSTKINFWEALADVESIKEKKEVSKFIVVYQGKVKKGLNIAYMEKISKIKNIKEIEFQDLNTGE